MIYMSLYDFIMLLCLPDYPFISVHAHDYERRVQKRIRIILVLLKHDADVFQI